MPSLSGVRPSVPFATKEPISKAEVGRGLNSNRFFSPDSGRLTTLAHHPYHLTMLKVKHLGIWYIWYDIPTFSFCNNLSSQQRANPPNRLRPTVRTRWRTRAKARLQPRAQRQGIQGAPPWSPTGAFSQKWDHWPQAENQGSKLRTRA